MHVHTHAHVHTLAHTWEWVVRAVMFHRKLLGGGIAWTRTGRIKGKPWAGTKWVWKVWAGYMRYWEMPTPVTIECRVCLGGDDARWEKLVGDHLKSAYESQEFWLSPKQGAITNGMWQDQIRSMFNRDCSAMLWRKDRKGMELRWGDHVTSQGCMCCVFVVSIATSKPAVL